MQFHFFSFFIIIFSHLQCKQTSNLQLTNIKYTQPMKNTLLIDRSRSMHTKTPSINKQLISKTLHTSNYKNPRYQTVESNDNIVQLDDFFDKFHQTFVVLEMKSKQPNKVKGKKLNDATDNSKIKCAVKNFIPKVTKDLRLSKQLISIAKKSRKSTKETSKMNKTCKSDRNILKSTTQHNNRVSTKKVTEKKTQLFSKSKPQTRQSKRDSIKKHIYGTGSTTATTTLGNSGINLKEDIHIASYLRIKIK